MDATKRFCDRFDSAKRVRDTFASLVDDCYEFALPLRQRTYMSSGLPPEMDRLFDGTAVTALQGFASQTLDDVWPADQIPFELKAGGGFRPEQRDEMDRALADIAGSIIELTNNSNFRSAAHEMLQDYAIGTGVMVQEEGDALRPLNFRAIPLTEAVLDVGPFGEIDMLSRERKLKAEHLKVIWPRARLPEALTELVRQNPRADVTVLEGYERDWSARGRERWVFRAIWRDGKNALLLEDKWEGTGSCPFVAPSFTRVAGEIMGRGPVMMALPDTKTANALRQLLLEHLDLSLSGIWQYDDNGTVNPDTVVLQPGALIPRAPGTRGLEPVTPAGRPDFGQMELGELRQQIRETMFVNDLGDLSKTPRTATEIMQRTADRARRLAGSYGRLMTEWLFPQVARTWWLMRKAQGRLGDLTLPPIDGDRVKIRPLSPITRAQAQDDILRHLRYLEMLQVNVHPMAPLVLTDVPALASWLAEKQGVNPNLLQPEGQLKAVVAQLMQVALAGGAAQAGPPA
jgi:hypothetical protein